MGRGAGNAKTELLADYINKNCNGNYNIQKLLKIIDEYIIPESNNVQWGYDLSMYISGTMRSHVDNVYHLKKEYGCTVSEMYDVIEALTQQQRIRYGVGYSKEDFTYLDAVYHEVKSEKVGK